LVLLQLDNTLYAFGLIDRTHQSEGEGIKEFGCSSVADLEKYRLIHLSPIHTLEIINKLKTGLEFGFFALDYLCSSFVENINN
jgi:hypothetical protein